MTAIRTLGPGFRLGLLALLLPLAVARVEADVPPLSPVPTFFPAELKASYTARRSLLETQLEKFQKAADAFNAQSAEQQSDAEFARLEAARADYVAKATAYNKALYAAAIFHGQVEKMREAGKPLARAAATRGEFHIRLKDGREFYGAEALTIPLDGGTRVFTGAGARVQLLLPDETTFTIGANGDVVLDSFVYDPATGVPSQMAGQIAQGAFRWVTGNVQPHVTPIKLLFGVDAVGIRGTDFEMQFEPDGSGLVKLHAGVVDITEKTSGRIVTLEPQQQVHFAASGALDPVEPLAVEITAEH